MNEINKILSNNEKIIWEGKPQFTPYFVTQFTLLGCFALVTLSLGLLFTLVGEAVFGAFFLFLGILLGVSPFITYLSYRKLFYAITDKRVITQSGIIGTDFNTVDFDKIQNMSVNVGIIDKIFGKNSGTISIFSGNVTYTSNGTSVLMPFTLPYIENAYDVFEKLKKVSHDIKTDIEYPNDLRPKNNPGYNTEYKS
jgi:membrane protein YdbS with pleckstrin-like domain